MAHIEADTTRFLADAAALLASTAPTVSAQLNATRRDFPQQKTAQDKSTSCNACGTVFVLGWNCKTVSTKKDAPKRTRQDRLAANQNQTKRVDIHCSSCNSITYIDSVKPERKVQVRIEKHKPTNAQTKPSKVLPMQELPSIASTPPPGTDAGIKKRNRNKKSTLQSLLADRKPTETKKGYGLDLMDFMKT